MSLKSQVESIANEISGEVEYLPERAERARKAVTSATRDFVDRTSKVVRKHPMRSIVGAFAVGWLIAKVARHV